MMRFDVLTLFPELIESHMNYSIMKRASESGVIELVTHNPRDYTLDKHKKVDDTPFGGGAGMVLMCQPFIDAYNSLDFDCDYETLLLSPQGEKFTQNTAKELSKKEKLIFICGHYEGFDERIKTIIDMEISIGEYVLTGGEVPAMAITDTITRLIPGVITKESLDSESFTDNLLDYPTYTRPEVFRGMKVPEVLLSGHHKNIENYRKEERIKITKERNDGGDNLE